MESQDRFAPNKKRKKTRRKSVGVNQTVQIHLTMDTLMVPTT